MDNNSTRLWAWDLTRILTAISALVIWIPRGIQLQDNYSSAGIVVVSGPIPWTKWFVMTPSWALAVWLTVLISAALMSHRRFSRIAAPLFLAAALIMLGSEGLNIKAYDRLLCWISMVLIFAPVRASQGDRYARFLLVVVYSGLYLSTGLTKLLWETNGWLTGETLAYHLVDSHFGCVPLGAWMSSKPVLLAPLGIGTVIFEIVFIVAVWIRPINPWLLAAGIFFHIGVLVSLNVGGFSYVALSAYPALLDPTAARSIGGWFRKFVPSKPMIR